MFKACLSTQKKKVVKKPVVSPDTFANNSISIAEMLLTTRNRSDLLLSVMEAELFVVFMECLFQNDSFCNTLLKFKSVFVFSHTDEI